MKLGILILGAGLIAAAGAAAAEDGPGERIEERVVIMGGHGGPGGLDADRDGAVSRDEFRTQHDRMFARLDKNGDGRLSGDEFRHHGDGEHVEIEIGGPGAHRGPGHHGPGRHGPAGHGDGERDVRIVRHGPGEGGLDGDKDGKLSLEEFSSPLRDHFRQMDKNGSGFLEEDEMKGEHRVMFRRERKD